MNTCITQEFIKFARGHFRLDWDGIHGAPHWSRVRYNALLLADHYDVDRVVLQWFAFTHDLDRKDDNEDPGHGARAAELVAFINDKYMGLSIEQLALLQTACRGHSDGGLISDRTVMVCWDADRLDLARVGIEPDPRYLCTAFARRPETIRGAVKRSVPDFVLDPDGEESTWEQPIDELDSLKDLGPY